MQIRGLNHSLVKNHTVQHLDVSRRRGAEKKMITYKHVT